MLQLDWSEWYEVGKQSIQEVQDIINLKSPELLGHTQLTAVDPALVPDLWHQTISCLPSLCTYWCGVTLPLVVGMPRIYTFLSS